MLRATIVALTLLGAGAALADHHHEALRRDISKALTEHEIVYDTEAITDSQLASIEAILRTDDSRNEKRSAIIAILGLN